MNHLFKSFLRKFIIVFFDDILVYSPTLETHYDYLEHVLSCLSNAGFFLKFSKCLLGQVSLEYLGHIISAAGVAPDQSKISAMLQWPIPTNIKNLRGFLGLTGYYSRLIRNYANIAHPLTELLKKDSFNWNPAAQIAFEN